MSISARWLALSAVLVLASSSGSQTSDSLEVTGLAFTPDGQTLISVGLDGVLRWWDVRKTTERFHVPAHAEGAYGLALSADGRLLASAGGDRLVRLWDPS